MVEMFKKILSKILQILCCSSAAAGGSSSQTAALPTQPEAEKEKTTQDRYVVSDYVFVF